MNGKKAIIVLWASVVIVALIPPIGRGFRVRAWEWWGEPQQEVVVDAWNGSFYYESRIPRGWPVEVMEVYDPEGAFVIEYEGLDVARVTFLPPGGSILVHEPVDIFSVRYVRNARLECLILPDEFAEYRHPACN